MFVLFFKQRTADEMGTGDWSADVCSSDLDRERERERERESVSGRGCVNQDDIGDRSEERRVGKECRSRRSPYYQKKNPTHVLINLTVTKYFPLYCFRPRS